MKKILMCLVVAAVVWTAGADDFGRGGGYTGPSSAVVSKVSEVKKLPDDANVMLEGKIERRLGNEKYLFSDGLDTITVDIDDDEWRGLSIGADDVAIIYGEVDRTPFRAGVEIEVDRIEKKVR
ncbi:MAG: NirD/YgiW/YdeI family stress tolerance protein [Spirochaetaceae bacterium]|jgi:uncharacterized protein (TIGR00156 family)|nr:NirD/YgiW/YdeI family stress tolerance protein [Spirochaetaceae bacterium]